MKILAISKFLARALVVYRMVELYYLCVDIRNYRAAVHLRGVSLLLNNYSKKSKTPSPLSCPFKQCCIWLSRRFDFEMHRKQWITATLHHNIHLREKSLNVLPFSWIIHYSEGSWNNTRFDRVGGLRANMASARCSASWVVLIQHGF